LEEVIIESRVVSGYSVGDVSASGGDGLVNEALSVEAESLSSAGESRVRGVIVVVEFEIYRSRSSYNVMVVVDLSDAKVERDTSLLSGDS